MKMHIAPNYFLNPTHPITVSLVGCGGTGSQVLTCLGRIDHCLRSLGCPGLHVSVYDGDSVTEANIGRQLFYESDYSLNKAEVLVTRINTIFGTVWEAIPVHFDKKTGRSCNITISCVDNVKSRLELAKSLKYYAKYHQNASPYMKPYYWMDFGNGTQTGQVILGTLLKIDQPKSKKIKTVANLPSITERFDLSRINEKKSGPSCSLAEALQKQDLFINSSLAQLGSNIIWKLLTDGMIDKAGLYLNLKTMNSNSIPL